MLLLGTGRQPRPRCIEAPSGPGIRLSQVPSLRDRAIKTAKASFHARPRSICHFLGSRPGTTRRILRHWRRTSPTCLPAAHSSPGSLNLRPAPHVVPLFATPSAWCRCRRRPQSRPRCAVRRRATAEWRDPLAPDGGSHASASLADLTALARGASSSDPPRDPRGLRVVARRSMISSPSSSGAALQALAWVTIRWPRGLRPSGATSNTSWLGVSGLDGARAVRTTRFERGS